MAVSVSIAVLISGGATRLPFGVQLVAKDHVLVYRGGLSQVGNERLFELFDTARIKPDSYSRSRALAETSISEWT